MLIQEKSSFTALWGPAKTSATDPSEGPLFLSSPSRKARFMIPVAKINTTSGHHDLSLPKWTFQLEKQWDTVPEKSPELSIGPGYRLCSPTLYISQLSKPTYFFHCLNHRLSIRYLQTDKNVLYQKTWGCMFPQLFPKFFRVVPLGEQAIPA